MARLALLPCLAALLWPAAASAQCDCPVEGSIIVGHRGSGTNDGSETLPENTIESALAAHAEGAEMVEIDVQLTSDGALVLMHDDTVDRTTDGTGCVSALTLAEIMALDADGSSVVTLDAFFAGVTGGVNVEVKLHESAACPAQDLDATADAVVASIAADTAARQIIVSSFDLGVLQRIRASEPSIPIGFLATGAADIAMTATLGFEAIHLLAAVANARTVAQAHDAGLRMNVWTVDGTTDISRVLALGVDGVITNTAAEGVAARTAYCDAYVCPDADAGAPGADAGPTGGAGGGCSASGAMSPKLAVWLIALVALVRSRRRSRDPSGRSRT